jgi:hypothetical protein
MACEIDLPLRVGDTQSSDKLLSLFESHTELDLDLCGAELVQATFGINKVDRASTFGRRSPGRREPRALW